MARKPLRSQLNQIRAWVHQGRTDAWIAHQLDVSASELREFRRRHELAPGDEEEDGLDLRDEIEAEIEAATREEEEAEVAAAKDAEEAAAKEAEEAAAKRAEEGTEEEEPEGEEADGKEGDGEEPEGEEADGEEAEGEEPPRRRRRRGGRGRRRAPGALQASFDHGDKDGYGLWLDPAVADDPVYSEHWAGHRKVEVTVQQDQIVIKRS